MNCILLEDEPLALQIIQSYVEKVPFLTLQGTFRNPLTALNYLKDHVIDLIFLDINMPDLTGIQLFKSLQAPPLVIFTTAYSQYAIQSYDLNAVDYLLKPIEFDRFLKAVNKAYERFQHKSTSVIEQTDLVATPDFYFIKSGAKIFKVNREDILYITSDEGYAKYVTTQRNILSLEKLHVIEKNLSTNHFIRIHKSYVVAIKYIDTIEKGYLKIKDQRLPIGRVYRNDLLKRIT